RPSSRTRQVDGEGGPRRLRGRHLDAPLVRADDLFGDEEPQPQAAGRTASRSLVGRLPRLHRVEDPVELVGRNRGATIVDRDRDLVLLTPERDGDGGALRTVLDGVADQVAERLAEPRRVPLP